MCSPRTCRRCGKTGWSGCGAHVEQVMARVPADQRCRCDQDAEPAGTPAKRGWSLFRR